jgi:hypothetical protein
MVRKRKIIARFALEQSRIYASFFHSLISRITGQVELVGIKWPLVDLQGPLAEAKRPPHAFTFAVAVLVSVGFDGRCAQLRVGANDRGFGRLINRGD